MTALLSRFFSFPLLAKELTEAAARRRTYTIRVAYALLLFAVFAMIAPRWLWRSGYNPLYAMGAGHQMFESILILQYFGIALFLPALMSGRITLEKERDSLVLLFLTDLRPWAIVLQKYVGGLVPMLSFLLLAMPLGAIAYAFGGITTVELAWGIWILLLAALQVGAFSLMLSAWCRSTVAAFVGTYIFGLLLYAGPPLLWLLGQLMTKDRVIGDAFIFFLIPPAVKEIADPTTFAGALLASTPILISIALFLVLARVFLVRRAFLPPSNLFLRIFRQLDGIMQRSNRFAGNVMLIPESRSLPDDDPIAWREMTRRSLGKVHYLVRILVVIEIPVIVLCALASLNTNSWNAQSEMLSIMAAIFGTIAVLSLSVHAANTIVSERVSQTLEVLLTTPLTAREIVVQKARVLRRFMFVLAVPLLTIFGSECWLEAGLRDVRYGIETPPVLYLVCAVLTVAIYLPLVSWLSLWIGLKMRTRFKAIITALAAVVAWCVLPLVVFGIGGSEIFGLSRGVYEPLTLLSPLTAVAVNEFGSLSNIAFSRSSIGGWLVVLVNFAFYGAMLLLFRHLALSRADRYLRR